jgi:hypothetical protein
VTGLMLATATSLSQFDYRLINQALYNEPNSSLTTLLVSLSTSDAIIKRSYSSIVL